MTARELTDAECDAILLRVSPYINFDLIDKDILNERRALIRAGSRAVLAAGVAREPTAAGDWSAGGFWNPGADAAPREPVPEPVACWWTRDDDSDTWATGCGNLFTINDSDTPSDAGMKFCLYCGNPVDDSEPTREGGGT